MALRNEKECEELFEEITKSINEYSTDDCNINEETIKAEILEMLKTYRPIKIVNYEYGLSQNLKEGYRLIIREESDPSKVREFGKYENQDRWGCNSKCAKTKLQIRYGIVFAPIFHDEWCEAKDYSFAMKIQDLYKQGEVREAKKLVRQYNRLNMNTNQSLSASAPTDTNGTSSRPVLEGPILNDQLQTTINLSDDTTTSFFITNSTSVGQNDSNLVTAIGETMSTLNLMSPSQSSINDQLGATFPFEGPSTKTLKEVCDKLNIKYGKEAYKLWSKIEFEQLPTISGNMKLHTFKSKNIFECFSLLFTGAPEQYFLIQHTINEAFRDSLVLSGKMAQEEIDQIFISSTVSDEHLTFIATLLRCRIGVFKESRLFRYGEWDPEADILTIVLAYVDGFYSIVLDL